MICRRRTSSRQLMDELHVPAQLLYARRVDGHLQAALQAEAMFPIQKPLEALLRRLDQEEQMPLSIARAEKGHIELEELPLYSASIARLPSAPGSGNPAEKETYAATPVRPGAATAGGCCSCCATAWVTAEKPTS